MQCRECGSVVPPRAKPCGGNQPAFCSEKCRRERKRKTLKAWVEANKDRTRELDAEHRKRFNERHPGYFKQYYAEKRQERKKQSNDWYHANSERALDASRRYATANPDKVRMWARKSWAKRHTIKKRQFVESVDPRVVFKRDNGICGICKERVEMSSRWEVDHIIPISKGGLHSYANVQLAHRKCNRAKGARLVA
jgi:5-methylcytosine-specific restriction endonuclease McrA